MKAFAEKDVDQGRAIAARQLYALKRHHTGKLRLADVKQMFAQMRDPSDEARRSDAISLPVRRRV
jgi:hypothetical protein